MKKSVIAGASVLLLFSAGGGLYFATKGPTRQEQTASLDGVCAKHRALLAAAAAGMDVLDGGSDEQGADALERVSRDTRSFASAVRDVGEPALQGMVDALQESARKANTASVAWGSGLYAEGNESLSTSVEETYRALDIGENFGAKSCARNP